MWQKIETWINRIGKSAAWLLLVMVLLTVVITILRYFFSLGWIWLQELVVWMHGVVIMLTIAYALVSDAHVRVDVFYRQHSDRYRAIIDALGTVFFLIPVCLLIAWMSTGYVFNTWQRLESSVEAGGLPFPFVPLLKTTLLIMPVLLLLAGVARLSRDLKMLRSSTNERTG
ncbi:MAG: TRAP transporter small permease subunit [Gammaproteobacteria bacterium]|nr:TRAP transporter small permease subunit [Gammaproteobacteria bacterium]